MKRLSATLATMCLLACTACNKQQAGVPVLHPRQYIVVVDVSASRSDAVRHDDQQFLEELVRDLNFGDRLDMLQMQQANLSDRPLRIDFEMPEPRKTTPSAREKQDLEGDRQTAQDAIPEIFQTKDNQKILHTDIFSSLDVVSEKMRERGDLTSTEVIILSDMLQSAQGWEMEHLQRMPPPGWVDKSKAEGRLPKLDGACIAVIGEDTSSKDDPAIRAFWARYFAASGSRLDANDIRGTAPGSVRSLCQQLH